MLEVKIKRLHEDAVIPEYQTGGSSGLDLVALCDTSVLPGVRSVIQTGIAIALPDGLEAQVRPRSSLSRAHIDVLIGTIDSDYRGEVGVLMANNSGRRHRIKKGDRIAQLVIAPVAHVGLVEVDELRGTERGAGGFGSTGR